MVQKRMRGTSSIRFLWWETRRPSKLWLLRCCMGRPYQTAELSEKLQKPQNRATIVITKSSYDTSSRFLLNSLQLVGTIYRLEGLNKLNVQLSALIISPLLISVICLSQERRITIFARRRKLSFYSQTQELITWSRVSFTVALFCGTIFLRKYVHQIP